jgi:glycosyltransferase involved in cell wall biosynthesis
LASRERAGWFATLGRVTNSTEVRAAVELVIPVRNEQHVLERTVRRTATFLAESFPFPARLTIADNGSEDGTWELACRLRDELCDVAAVRLPRPGRGGALHETWLASRADVVAYMDADLSTDLTALLPLVAPLLSGHSDVAIGTRLAHGARVSRGLKREAISRCYNSLLHLTLGTRFTDAQCGFKALRADRARVLLAHVEDRGWFFDTELLVLAERCGLRIHEVPVDWVDDPDSRVDIVRTARDDLKGIVRMRRALAAGRLDLAAIRAELARPPELSSGGSAGAPGAPDNSLVGGLRVRA